jgi:phage baseplate assembly protein V
MWLFLCVKFMINELLNHMLLAHNRAQMNIGYPHLGIISSVNPTDYTVKVILQPEELETGFIPYCTPFYGWVAPPVGGEQCLVLFERGNNNVPVAALLLYWNNHRAPGVASDGDTLGGEILLKHSSGSYVKLSNDGKISINGNVEIDVTTPTYNVTSTVNITLQAPLINLKGNVVIDGTLSANSGDFVMDNTALTTNKNIVSTQDVTASGISLKTHVHSGVTSGGSDTGAPV